MKDIILKHLREENDYISGEKLSVELGYSRTAIWKHINTLRKEGYVIDSVTKRGYKLISSPDLIDINRLKENKNTQLLGKDILYFDSVLSTNQLAKDMASELTEGTVIVAEEQTQGKGRRGRQWQSLKHKGIYTTIFLTPEVESSKLAGLTILAAAALHQALLKFGVDSKIKWPNDILINGKKVCGILTELSGELGVINRVALGIGINVLNESEDFSDSLRNSASSIYIETSKKISRTDLLLTLLEDFEELYLDFINNQELDKALEIAIKNSAVLGKEVQILKGNTTKVGTALTINKEGALLVRFSSGVEVVNAGEVSLRPQ